MGEKVKWLEEKTKRQQREARKEWRGVGRRRKERGRSLGGKIKN